ncbi:alkaline phosphatase family protein [Aureispira anguillae]|uniref:Alkaline phosphatase family protein n=1 Tax=Aureispira anguillae TaxID=2864201 RepID=A0A915YM35_9BACT|nr:alkaline phosphatase family protein [Aureispira anguillae]BDS15451.1 alkaline phosphatase family protein [Aureispira anguillae]
MQYSFLLILVMVAMGMGSCEKSTLATCPTSCSNDNLQHIKRVLLVGIDGCRSDAVQKAATPHLDQLIQNGRYSWEVDCDRADAWAAVGWSSLLTGVWANKHGVYDDFYGSKNYEQYPHFLCRIKNYNSCFRTASIVHYSDLNDEIAAPCNSDVLLDYDEDKKVREATKNYIDDCNLDVLFVNFDDVDHAGHLKGFHPDIPHYINAIEQVDAHLGVILEAIYQREANKNEDWLIIVSSNHGGEKDGTHLNASHPDVGHVLGLFRKRNMTHRGLMPVAPSLVDIVPTILDHLSVPVDTTWGLDGRSLNL